MTPDLVVPAEVLHSNGQDKRINSAVVNSQSDFNKVIDKSTAQNNEGDQLPEHIYDEASGELSQEINLLNKPSTSNKNVHYDAEGEIQKSLNDVSIVNQIGGSSRKLQNNAKKQVLHSAHPSRQIARGKRQASEGPIDLSSKGGVLAHLDNNQSRLSNDTRQS